MILNAFFLAFRQIRRNFLRALLTMLGIIIGVSAVVIMITLGNGTTQVVTDRISSLGSNILLVFPARNQNIGGGGRKQFSLDNIRALNLQVGDITRAIAPITSTSLLAQFRQENTQTQVQGVNQAYFLATNWLLSNGNAFSQQDYRAGSNVCM